MCILTWLDQHAAAVQAVATVVLVGVTVVYVRLTRQLALTATAQERRAQVADQVRRAGFADLLTRLRNAVDSGAAEIKQFEDHLRSCGQRDPLPDNPTMGEVMRRLRVAVVDPA